ncbi:MAG: hypothetical protein H0X04_00030 [Chthoniobacterales bacterium]|nr:hypothetical protein [Chthoniobacterales bacterium]
MELQKASQALARIIASIDRYLSAHEDALCGALVVDARKQLCDALSACHHEESEAKTPYHAWSKQAMEAGSFYRLLTGGCSGNRVGYVRYVLGDYCGTVAVLPADLPLALTLEQAQALLPESLR